MHDSSDQNLRRCAFVAQHFCQNCQGWQQCVQRRRAKKSVSVASWLTSYKLTLDVMPDQGWYMLTVVWKYVLFGHYDLDAVAWPHLYERCKKNHFLHVWNTLFPEIRLRKHCRFAKCGFCVQMRELQTSGTATSDEKAVVKERLSLHVRQHCP